MGHYAKVNNGLVTKVIVADQDFINSYVDNVPGEWVKTSYNTRGGIYYTPDTNTPDPDQSKAFRKNFAGEGYTYDIQKDAFIPPRPPFASWKLDEFSCLWLPPVPHPDDGNLYSWDEADQQWILITQEKV